VLNSLLANFKASNRDGSFGFLQLSHFKTTTESKFYIIPDTTELEKWFIFSGASTIHVQSDQKEYKLEQALQIIIGHVVAESYANKHRQFVDSIATL
jgi:hypothetical protein